MDKILITYRGGYGDVYSVLTYFNEIKNSKITFLVEEDHVFLKELFKNVNFILNPIQKIMKDNNDFFSNVLNKHIYLRENVNFNQDFFDDSVVETSFFKISKFKPYYNFYKKLIDQNDLIITNYLDLTAINCLLESNKEWWQIRSWYQWRNDLNYVKLLNQKSPYKNIYYYEKEWIKGFPVDPDGDYKYRDNDFFYYIINKTQEETNLSFRLKDHKKVFFATLGSMSKYNLTLGNNMKYKFILECKKLFEDGWVGITTKREYEGFLKNIENNKFVYLLNEWYPHDFLFNKISLFLTHGGAGSFSRGIRCGVKMYVFPFQLDQRFFGEIVEKHYDGKMIV